MPSPTTIVSTKRPWILKQRFQIPRAYDILSSEVTSSFLKAGDWEAFYKRYPESGGFIVLSALDFNKDQTRAIVYNSSYGSRRELALPFAGEERAKWELGSPVCFLFRAPASTAHRLHTQTPFLLHSIAPALPRLVASLAANPD